MLRYGNNLFQTFREMARNEDCSVGHLKSLRVALLLNIPVRYKIAIYCCTPHRSHILPWAYCFYREN